MTLLKTEHYQFKLNNVAATAAIFAAVVIFMYFSTGDALKFSYALVIPIFVFISMILNTARIKELRFLSWRGWIETLLAFAIAAAVPFIGYRFWLMGY